MYEKAIEYLKYLHALEIAAGMNFRRVINDTRGPEDLHQFLHVAVRQEMNHARIVRNMLTELGYTDLSALMDMPVEIVARLAEGIALKWPSFFAPWAGIEINRIVEERFANGGLVAFCAHMTVFAQSIEDWQRQNNFLSHIQEFLAFVQSEELWHVELDQKICAHYQALYPDFRMSELVMSVHVTRSPFIHAIRARQAFIRSLP